MYSLLNYTESITQFGKFNSINVKMAEHRAMVELEQASQIFTVKSLVFFFHCHVECLCISIGLNHQQGRFYAVIITYFLIPSILSLECVLNEVLG